MSKLTKAQAKAHKEACELIKKDKLTFTERLFVLEHWQESAKHVNSIAGAFFTPVELASAFAFNSVSDCESIIDLGAGIGALAFMHYLRAYQDRHPVKIVCLEANPDYVAAGKKVLPEATWICADILDVARLGLGHFDMAIANPPFGSVDRQGKRAPRFTGADFQYHAIDIASDIADHGFFIIPKRQPAKYDEFSAQTNITLNCTSQDIEEHRNKWRGVSPAVEIVHADFEVARTVRSGLLMARAV